MSRSLSERIGAALRPREAAGIAVGRDYVAFASVARSGQRVDVCALAQCRLDAPLFCGAPDTSALQQFAGAVRSATRELGHRYLPVHVSLPDAAVRTFVMELDELPANTRALGQLVEFRLARESGKPPGRCVWRAALSIGGPRRGNAPRRESRSCSARMNCSINSSRSRR